ncbi:MAG: hypothetical protein MJ087_03265 [Lachnospiraceae bacterium]|nr:hypothetical protein [Lachnospiraceae bacterium]
MELIVANIITGLSQTYLMAQFFTLFSKSKYSQHKTTLFYWMAVFIYSTGINYLTPDSAGIKIVVGVVCLSIVNCRVLEGPLFVSVLKAIVFYFLLSFFEIVMIIVMAPFYFDGYVPSFEITPMMIMVRVLYGMLFYVFVVFAEMLRYRKKTPEYMPVFRAFFALGILELGIFKCVVLLDSSGVSRHFVLLAVVSGMITIFQYYLCLEILRSHIAKKEQEALMEEMQKEQDYHYESYQLANKQNEKLRDIRHDMNNYLQTILTLGEDEMTKEQAGSMIEELKRKVQTAFGS